MRPLFRLAGAALLGCLSCGAQTNCSVATPLKFALEPLRLRSQPPQEIGQTKPSAPVALSLSASKADASFETGLNSGEFQSRIIRPGELYLTQAAPPSDNSLVRFVDGVFRPVVIQFNK